MQAAYRWYEREREGLGEEFLQIVDRVVGIIADYPEGFPVVHRDIRRALLKRFPYSVIASKRIMSLLLVVFIRREIRNLGKHATDA